MFLKVFILINRVKQILTRNQIRLIKKKPNQIKDEIYRLKYE